MDTVVRWSSAPDESDKDCIGSMQDGYGSDRGRLVKIGPPTILIHSRLRNLGKFVNQTLLHEMAHLAVRHNGRYRDNKWYLRHGRKSLHGRELSRLFSDGAYEYLL